MAERGNELEKRYQQSNVNNFIWNSRKFFVSLRAGWVEMYLRTVMLDTMAISADEFTFRCMSTILIYTSIL